MNRREKPWLLVAGACLMACPLFAGEGTVANPTSGMKWKVEIQPSIPGDQPLAVPSKMPPPSAAGAIVREDNCVNDGLRKESKIHGNGSILTRYAREGLIFYIDPRTKEPSIESSGPQAYGGELTAGRFDEFSWIDKRWHQGQKTIDDVVCDVYVHSWPLIPAESARAKGPSSDPAPASTQPATSHVMTAYIAREDGLPVALVTPVEIRRYSFSRNQEPLALPSELAEALEQREAAIRWRRQRFDIPQ